MGKAAVKDSGEAGHQLKEDGGKEQLCRLETMELVWVLLEMLRGEKETGNAAEMGELKNKTK